MLVGCEVLGCQVRCDDVGIGLRGADCYVVGFCGYVEYLLFRVDVVCFDELLFEPSQSPVGELVVVVLRLYGVLVGFELLIFDC